MVHLIDKSALIAEIKKIRGHVNRLRYAVDANCIVTVRNACECLESSIDLLVNSINTLEVKEVQEEPAKIWHDAKEPPEMYRKYFARYSDGRISGSWERHDDGFIPWKDVIKEHNITHWCYVEDLLKLKYYDR